MRHNHQLRHRVFGTVATLAAGAALLLVTAAPIQLY